MKKISILLFSIFILNGCKEIETKSLVISNLNARNIVGIGDVVYSAEKRKSLPNAFGKADLFGRTTAAGKTTVVYSGTKDGKAFFERKSIDIDSGETTMNRSGPIVIPSTGYTYHSGMVGNTSITGYSVSQQNTVIPAPQKPDAITFDRGSQFIAVELKNLPITFPVDGYKITVLSATQYQAEVLVSK